jgi:phosphatidylglycerol:prolipoprotein diacylglycerol transferase
MIPFPNINPVALEIGFLQVHWYGISYVLGIGFGWYYLETRARASNVNVINVSDMVFYVALGAVVGGRIGYILFYNLAAYYNDPLSILAIWKGGMSFHGGVLGVALVLIWQARKVEASVFALSDFIVPALPIGLGLGRLANFVNQELWGAPTDLPWGVVFTVPAAGGFSRHPTQLYEAFLEGLLLFLILHFMSKRKLSTGKITGLFLLLYGCFRSLVELLREPDSHIGYLYSNWLTMGQLLCAPMILIGLIIIIFCYNRKGTIA